MSEQGPFAIRSNVLGKRLHGVQEDSSFVFGVSVKMSKCDAKGQRELGHRQASDRLGSKL